MLPNVERVPIEKILSGAASAVTIVGFIYTVFSTLRGSDGKTIVELDFPVRIATYVLVECSFAYVFSIIMVYFFSNLDPANKKQTIDPVVALCFGLVLAIVSEWQTILVAYAFFHPQSAWDAAGKLVFPFVLSNWILLIHINKRVVSLEKEQEKSDSRQPFETTYVLSLGANSVAFVAMAIGLGIK